MAFEKIYNESFMQNGTNIVDMVDGINRNLDGLFVNGILFIVWIIVFVAAQSKFATIDSFLGASAITLLVSAFFFASGLSAQTVIIVPLIAVIGSVIAKFVVR